MFYFYVSILIIVFIWVIIGLTFMEFRKLLHSWGFKQVYADATIVLFVHPSFKRDREDLLPTISANDRGSQASNHVVSSSSHNGSNSVSGSDNSVERISKKSAVETTVVTTVNTTTIATKSPTTPTPFPSSRTPPSQRQEKRKIAEPLEDIEISDFVPGLIVDSFIPPPPPPHTWVSSKSPPSEPKQKKVKVPIDFTDESYSI